MMSEDVTSAFCEAHIHRECDLSACDCICHLYKPRTSLSIKRLIITAAIVWAVLFTIGYVLSYVLP